MKATRERGRQLIAVGTALMCALLAWSPRAFALNAALDVSQYAHTAWKIREGFAKGAINAIAQTPDGYLWLGTEFGLIRFDGVRAVPWQPPPRQPLPSGRILSLLAARGGTLWIGTDTGLASWNGRTLSGYAEVGGAQVGSMAEDREGSIWFSAYPRGLCAIRHGHADCTTVGEGRSYIAGLFFDRSGALWVGARNGLWRWKPGPPVFVGADENQNGFRGIVDADDGSIFASRRGQLLRVADGRATVAATLPAQTQRFQTMRMLRDRDGGIWVATSGGGLVHIHQGRTDVFTRADGLSNDAVLAMYEDRERNIWVSTDGGLDRFHETAASALSVAQGLSSSRVISVLADGEGAVWIGANEGLNRWKNGQLTVYRNERVPAATPGATRPDNVREVVGRGLPEHGVHSIYEDSRGRVWIATGFGFGFLDGERFVPVDVGRPIDRVNTYSIVEDSRGTIWMATLELGLLCVDLDGAVRQVTLASLNRAGDVLSTLLADPSGDGVWIGFSRSGLAYLADGRLRASYSPSDGLAGGRITALYRDADGTLWIAAEQGLSRLKDGRIATFTRQNGLPCDQLHWVIEDATHALWMDTPCGLVRVARAELDAASTLNATIFDASDGVPIVTSSGGYGPHVTRSLDGRLWFGGVEGANIIDPQRLSTNTLPPPVHVERVTADRRIYEGGFEHGPMRLPPLIRDLQIDYTALSLVAPEKMQFRYKLEGWDRDWQDAGNRRQAFYTNLNPGTYRFRVRASNNSGVWNETGDAVDFSIAPAYYQTAWFIMLSALAALALPWALYQRRMRRVANEFNVRLDERVTERTRIARELHDTLLQGFHGLLFRFQAVSNMLPARPVEAKQQLDGAIDQVAQAITEGRDAVQNLRASTVIANDLAEAITTLGAELAAAAPVAADANPPRVDVSVEGTPRDLHPILRDDVYRIAGEALRNAFRHAGARRIEVEIRYGDTALQVRVRDDGQGIDAVLLDEQRPGHFGIRGMRERAELAGGHLDVWSKAGLGTEVELTIPAAAAYATPRVRSLSSWFARKTGTNA